MHLHQYTVCHVLYRIPAVWIAAREMCGEKRLCAPNEARVAHSERAECRAQLVLKQESQAANTLALEPHAHQLDH